MSEQKNKQEQAQEVAQENLHDAYQFQVELEDLTEKNAESKEMKKIAELEAKVIAAEEKAKIALADYQNLVRRTREERVMFIQNAGQEFVEAMIGPLQNLGLAAKALNDKGLNMVIGQFWQTLNEQGLEEMNGNLVGQEFDVETMEAVEKDGKGTRVKSIVTPGYRMNGRVIQHAKVVVG